MVQVLGVDPGFANMGIVGVKFKRDLKDSKIIYTKLVRTAKSAKKRNIRKNSDDQRRHSDICTAFTTALVRVQPRVVSMESVSFVRNASTMCNIGGAWYGLYYILQGPGVSVADYSPQELKVVATGKKTASKKDMIRAVNKQWPNQIDWTQWPESKWEHIADAAIAAMAAILDKSLPWSLILPEVETTTSSPSTQISVNCSPDAEPDDS